MADSVSGLGPSASPDSEDKSSLASSKTIERFPSRGDIENLAHTAILFVAHSIYRRYSPRKWPTLTSLKLPELYGGYALSWSLSRIASQNREEIAADNDLNTIEAAARLIRHSVRERRAVYVEALSKDLKNETARHVREVMMGVCRESYVSRMGLLGKVAWWHNHRWHSEEDWLLAAAFYLGNRSFWTQSMGDGEICITHTANMLRTDPKADYGDNAEYPLVALAASMPLAMWARATGNPLYYFPLNGLQRLLFGAFLYTYKVRRCQHYAYLHTLRDKHRLADILRGIFEGDRTGGGSGEDSAGRAADGPVELDAPVTSEDELEQMQRADSDGPGGA